MFGVRRAQDRRKGSIHRWAGALVPVVVALSTAIMTYAGFAVGWSDVPSRTQLNWAIAAAGTAFLSALAGRHVSRERKQASAGASNSAGPQAYNRNQMLRRVRTFWIEGVLEQSLESVAWIELGLHQRPDAVRARPGLLAHSTSGRRYALPAQMSMGTIFDENSQALLILGAPGSGKTTLLLKLAAELLERAKDEDAHPIPVVFNLASWAKQRSPLTEWLVDELADVYDVPHNIGQGWVDNDHVLPLLDGLDEVAEVHREGCVEAINTFREHYGLVPVVVCSRTAEHAALAVRLRLLGAVEIQPLGRLDIWTHLEQIGEPLAGVHAALRDDPTLWDLLKSPLLLSIVALAYHDKPATDLRAIGTLEERRQRLFTAYVSAMFERRSQDPRFPEDKTIQWLTWMARSLQRHNQTEFYLERLQRDWLPSLARQRLMIAGSGVAVGLLVGLLTGLIHDLRVAPLFGLAAGLFYGLGERYAALPPDARLRWSWEGVRNGLGWMVVVGLVVGIFNGLRYGLIYEPRIGWITGLDGVFAGMVVGMFHGLSPGPPNARSPVSHERIPRLSRRAVIAGIIVGLLAALILGARFVLFGGLDRGIVHGLFFGPLFWLVTGLLFELGERSAAIRPAAHLRWSWSGVKGQLGATVLPAVLVVPVVTLSAGQGLGPEGGFVAGVFAGVLTGALAALFYGLSPDELDKPPTIPNEGIRRSARNGLFTALVVGSPVGLISTAIYGSQVGMDEGLLAGLYSGLYAALLGGLFYGGMACLQHLLLRSLLVREDHTPRQYIDFLDYATQHLFLRKVGGGYIFIHRLLLEYFAQQGPHASMGFKGGHGR